MLATIKVSCARALVLAERYSKTDIRYVLNNSGWLILGQIGVSLSALLLSVAFAHFVPKDTYGTYRYLLSVFWILSAFCFTGLPAAVMQAVARGYEGSYLRSFRLSILWGLPLTFVASGTSIYYFLQSNNELGYGLLVIAFLGPLMQPALLYAAFLEGKKDFKRYSLYGIGVTAIASLLSCVAMFFTKSPLIFVTTYLLGTVASGFVFNYLAYRVHKPNISVSDELGRVGFHFSVMNVFVTIAHQLDKLVVYHYLGAIQLAVYTFATALPDQLKGFLSNISSLALPKFAVRKKEEISQNFWGRMALYILLIVPITAIYIVAAPFFFHLLFPLYNDSIFYSQIFALSLISTPNTVPLAFLQAHAAKRELYIYNLISPLFQIVVLIWLTIVFGLLGTIISRIITRFFNLFLLSFLVYWYTRVSKDSPQDL